MGRAKTLAEQRDLHGTDIEHALGPAGVHRVDHAVQVFVGPPGLICRVHAGRWTDPVPPIQAVDRDDVVSCLQEFLDHPIVVARQMADPQMRLQPSRHRPRGGRHDQCPWRQSRWIDGARRNAGICFTAEPAWLSQRQAHPRAERAARTCDSIHGMQKASTVLSAAAGRSCRLFNFGKRK